MKKCPSRASLTTRRDARMTKTIAVFGSVNVDHVFTTPTTIPKPGETVGSARYEALPGGKGANQACAAATVGKDVGTTRFVGAVNASDEWSIDALRGAGVSTEDVERVDGAQTGSAAVIVDGKGENCIVVAPGANALVDPQRVPRCDVLLLQCEVPLEANLRACARARALNAEVCVVLNYAPATEICVELVEACDVLVVNETERDSLVAAFQREGGERTIFDRCVGVVTRGAAGATLIAPGSAQFGELRVAALEMESGRVVVDTVGAGDAFVGALVASMAKDDDCVTAMCLASAAGSLACTERGARPKIIAEASLHADSVRAKSNASAVNGASHEATFSHFSSRTIIDLCRAAAA